ncbi:MAG: hypothetical protein M5U12_20975 [Verrucomicrobia bacterium]|nr:hypothetical protein [Verrucomicrobiota bacterium]
MYCSAHLPAGTLEAAPTNPTLQPRCYRRVFTIPATFAALEDGVQRWISTCVMSRTRVPPGVPIRRERDLVNANPSLQQIWTQVLRHRVGQPVEIRAEYVWGPHRVESIRFSTPRPATPTPATPALLHAHPCPPPVCTPVGPFLPSRHGFRFTNSFSATIPLPRPLPAIPASFGLCGGMASAALDYFLACIPIPSASTVPTAGSPLFNYLLRRQLDSLGAPGFGLVQKFLTWTNRPDVALPAGLVLGPLIPGTGALTVDGLQELTAPELNATTRSLAAGQRVVLGLIYVGPGAVSIWRNHQVLAYDATSAGAVVTQLRVYDPNAPGDDNVVIRCERLAGGARVRCVQVTRRGTTRVRGFFRMPYVRRTPPCLP